MCTEGHTANEVETEQIVSNDAFSAHTMHTSFVQLRGSVPLFWSQVSDPMIPKPDVSMQYTCMCVYVLCVLVTSV